MENVIRMLLIEDDASVQAQLLRMLDQVLSEQCAITTAATLEAASAAMGEGHYDVVIQNIRPVETRSLDFIRQLHSDSPEILIISMVEDLDSSQGIELIRAGAHDCLEKSRLTPAILRRNLNYAIEHTRVRWEAEQRRHAERLQESLIEVLQRIMNLTVERHDPYRRGRERRVALLASAIAQRLEFTSRQINTVHVAALLLDIGMIELPAVIINQPSLLLDPERRLIESHPRNGWEILHGVAFDGDVATVVLQHHEHIDGSGYPEGLQGAAIMPEARVIAVADAVEAMCSRRAYRDGLDVQKVEQELIRRRGTWYAPDVIDACLNLLYEDGFKWCHPGIEPPA